MRIEPRGEPKRDPELAPDNGRRYYVKLSATPSDAWSKRFRDAGLAVPAADRPVAWEVEGDAVFFDTRYDLDADDSWYRSLAQIMDWIASANT